MNREPGRLNATGGLVVPLGTSIEEPIERLREISAATNLAKAELRGLSPKAMEQFNLFGFLPLVVGHRLRALAPIPPLFNFTVPNMALSEKPLYLFGAELDAIVPLSFLNNGYGLCVTLVSYIDRVNIGFVGCRDTFPEPASACSIHWSGIRGPRTGIATTRCAPRAHLIIQLPVKQTQ